MKTIFEKDNGLTPLKDLLESEVKWEGITGLLCPQTKEKCWKGKCIAYYFDEESLTFKCAYMPNITLSNMYEEELYNEKKQIELKNGE